MLVLKLRPKFLLSGEAQDWCFADPGRARDLRLGKTVGIQNTWLGSRTNCVLNGIQHSPNSGCVRRPVEVAVE